MILFREKKNIAQFAQFAQCALLATLQEVGYRFKIMFNQNEVKDKTLTVELRCVEPCADKESQPERIQKCHFLLGMCFFLIK